MFEEATTRTARLMAQWQAVGFNHGVMNTDNMSILGFTLDFGPFGFLDEFDAGHICNHSDPHGRYAFDQQPGIARWNLGCLAQALLPVAERDDLLLALHSYEGIFNEEFHRLLRAKLGLRESRDEDQELLVELFAAMQRGRVDHTNFFRVLGRIDSSASAGNGELRAMFRESEIFDTWATKYRARLRAEGGDDAERRVRMDAVNPKFVLRNWLAQRAITKATRERDFSEIERLRLILREPFEEQPGNEEYSRGPREEDRHLVVSCSS
jgi:uncharacterized protein YdiU (UPF0061 family)